MIFMNWRIQAAEGAVASAADAMNASGLTVLVRELLREVWATNLARYEPEERGDAAKSLGIQCSENIRELVVRRVFGDDLVTLADRWRVADLVLSTPRGVLTLSLSGFQVVTMKVPHAQGRAPIWERFPDWDTESQARHDVARENARVLGGSNLQHPAQDELEFPDDVNSGPGLVRRFMLVWGGEPDGGLTAGWLTVPVSWSALHFAAIKPLWHDEADDAPGYADRAPAPSGPSFDQRPVTEPYLALKPRPRTAGGDQA
jgi:hypothetical protein